jgi:DNA replication protein DnaC
MWGPHSKRIRSFTKWLLQLARVDVLLVDDWGMAPLDAVVRNDLLER